MYSEDELLPLSALQHLQFCERQCALIHIEQIWQENRYTVEGRHLHDKVHEHGAESRGDLRIVRSLPLRSLKLGVSGIADVVEFRDGHPYPVEYKRGKPKQNHCDEVQLCVQALCLEEMLSASISEGALFYGKKRRRHPVEFTDYLRKKTVMTADRLHALVRDGQTPVAAYEKKCDACSLYEVCLPRTTGARRSAKRYLSQELGLT